MRSTFVLALAGCLAAAPLVAQGPSVAFRDPLAAVEPRLDATAKEILAAFPAYDAARIGRAVAALEARRGAAGAQPLDEYMIGQGCLELLVVQRFYERWAEDAMPAELRGVDPDEVAERGLAAEQRFAAEHPADSDAQRVIGELYSYQIRGMAGGMTKGPKARKAIDRARELDRTNCWAEFARGRMHFHNPAFVGGDKDKALREFRALSKQVEHFRISLYLAWTYRAKDLLPQAEYWAAKALQQAPHNPEAEWLVRAVAAAAGGAR